jgi:DNA-binding NarL/FixJ family response regulator
MIRVSIIEDQELVIQGLKSLIDSRPDFELGYVANTVEDYLSYAQSSPPHVILLDIGLPGGMNGLEGIRPLKEALPETDLIMLTTFDDSERVFKALCAGASAYVTKRTPFAKIAEVITIVHAGGSYMSPAIARLVVDHFAPKHKTIINLTPRQKQIADAMVDGLSYKMIADKLMVSTETVRDHIKKMFKKLEINSKGELISMHARGQLD